MHAILLAAMLASAAQSSAQSGPGPDSADIVVQAGRTDDAAIQQFIRAMTAGPRGIQIGQFDDGICPLALGLGQAEKAAVERRMRRVARAAGVPAAKEKCTPNILLIVASDKAEAVKALRKERPGLMWGMSGDELDAPGPAIAWHFTGLHGSDGLQVTENVEGIRFASSFNTPSRTRSSSRPRFLGSVLVVETGALAGVSTIQLADYAALRTFAQTDPARAAKTGSRTILTLIDDRAAGRPSPLSLTEWDLSFLKALYVTSNTDVDSVQRASMKQAFKRDLRRKAKTRQE
ncbi:MAG TPA: hypothetical protein VD846_12230 [Allosphingosinicella sp.]|nr:hypothetical protein [Allosphingosinicella sp.]